LCEDDGATNHELRTAPIRASPYFPYRGLPKPRHRDPRERGTVRSVRVIVRQRSPRAAGGKMAITRQAPPDWVFDVGSRIPLTAPIVVGTDGHQDANGAIRITRLLSERRHARVHVVAALDAPSAPLRTLERLPQEADVERRAALRHRIDHQLRALAIPPGAWPVEIATGRPDGVLADAVVRDEAGLVVVGVGSHGLLARVSGTATALGIARIGGVPVLAVDRHTLALPRNALIGMDFSTASVAAARGALDCLGERGTLHLAYVQPITFVPGAHSADAAYDQELADRFAAVVSALGPEPTVQIAQHVLAGDAARQLLLLADQVKADLIAVGAHGHGRLNAFMIGTTASRILATSKGAVLMTTGHGAVATASAD